MTLSRPVVQNNPILTIRWINTEIEGNIGPDLKFTLQVAPEKVVKGRVKEENTDGGIQAYDKCLFQRPIIGFALERPYSYTIQLTVEEEDPVNSYGPIAFEHSFNVKVPLVSDPNVDLLPGNEVIEPIIHEATDYDGPRFGTRNARFSFNCRWYLTTDISDTIFYIASEMDINKDSVEVLIIKSLNRMAKEDFESVWLQAIVPFFSPLFAFDELIKGLAYVYWAWLVRPDGKWDHKPSITPTLGLYSLDAPQGKQYRNDIWSNMHYGYIGKVAGFTEKELIGGAGLAQVIDDLIKASKKDFNRLIGIANDIVSLDPDKAWNALRDLITDTDIQEVLTQVYERFRQEGITGLDNNDDSGSVLLGSDRLYDEYGDSFVNNESSRDFILGIVRRRRKYSPNSQLKKDAPEGICSI